MKDSQANSREQHYSELMRRTQEGDEEAYGELLTEISCTIRSFLKRRLHRVEETEDLVQEVLLAIHRARHTYDPSKPFSAWMYAIARYKLIDYTRRWKRKLSKEVKDEFAIEQLISPDITDGGIESDLQALVAELPDKQRRVVQMLKYEDLSIKETAKRLGASESAVKVNAHRAYKALKLKIENGKGGN